MNEQLITPIIERFRKSKDIDLCFVSYLRVSGCWDILETLARDKQRETIENADAAMWDDMLKDKVLPRQVVRVLLPRIPTNDAWECIKQLFDCVDDFKDFMTSYLDKDKEYYLIKKIDSWANPILNTVGEVRVITITSILDVWNNCKKRLERENTKGSSQGHSTSKNIISQCHYYTFNSNDELYWGYVDTVKELRKTCSEKGLPLQMVKALANLIKNHPMEMTVNKLFIDSLRKMMQEDENIRLPKECTPDKFYKLAAPKKANLRTIFDAAQNARIKQEAQDAKRQ